MYCLKCGSWLYDKDKGKCNKCGFSPEDGEIYYTIHSSDYDAEKKLRSWYRSYRSGFDTDLNRQPNPKPVDKPPIKPAPNVTSAATRGEKGSTSQLGSDASKMIRDRDSKTAKENVTEETDSGQHTGKRSLPILIILFIALCVGAWFLGRNSDSIFGNTEAQSQTQETNNTNIDPGNNSEINTIVYLRNNIQELNVGLSEGLYKQVLFGDTEMYCLKKDGTVCVFACDPDSGQSLNEEYGQWNNIDSLVLGYEESLLGIGVDGSVTQSSNSRTFDGRTETNDWDSIIQLNATNPSVVFGLQKDGTILYTPGLRKFNGENLVDEKDLEMIRGSIKIVSEGDKAINILGLSSSGTIKGTSHAPRLYRHSDNQWNNDYLNWDNLIDIEVTQGFSSALFGLTKDGRVLYGGTFGYGGETSYFDAERMASWSGINDISAGEHHIVALKSDGTVVADGHNGFNQCNVSEWKDIVRVEAFGKTTVAWASDGRIYYTGDNCLERQYSKLLGDTKNDEWKGTSNSRHSYTIEEINSGLLGDTITFNSIEDGKIGNEKNFVAIREQGSDNWFARSINVKDGSTYTVRLYVHNNSPKGYEAIAKNVTAALSLPTTADKTQLIIGYISCSNSQPVLYVDGVFLESEDPFYIEYVNGSAEFTNALIGEVALSDNLLTSGVLLGYESLDGSVPGCFEYEGVITVELIVHKSND